LLVALAEMKNQYDSPVPKKVAGEDKLVYGAHLSKVGKKWKNVQTNLEK